MDKYLITIDKEFGENLGVELISFVSNPAILTKGMAFSASDIKVKFASDEIKMRIVAPAMIPMDIYRFDKEDDYEYEVQFTAEVIEQIRGKFMQNLTNADIFNLEHTSEIVPAYILETWIVGEDPKKDKAYSEYGIEVPTGTMMVMSQITDKTYYDNLVANGQVAYSIEGMFGFSDLQLSEIKNNKIKMEDLMLPDGEHTIGEKIYVVKDGKIIEVKDVVKEEEVIAEVVEEKIKPEEVVAEEIVEEIKPEEVVAEVVPADEAAVLAIIQPKLDEIYKMIADIKAGMEEEIIEKTPEQVQMSIHEKFGSVMNLIKEK